MDALIFDGGARGHVLSEAYERSGEFKRIIIAPGNSLTAWNRNIEVIADSHCSLKDTKSMRTIARKYKPDLVDVAQDDALNTGIADILRNDGFTVFGPGKNEARIESDKLWSRDFMKRHMIPIPHYRAFHSTAAAIKYSESHFDFHSGTLYVKATKLCAGKGAVKATNITEAEQAIKFMQTLGDAGRVFLIENALTGSGAEEFSYFAISDGKTYKSFRPAQDNKTVYDNDLGPNTGGMGANSPALVCKGIEETIEREHVAKAINGMRKEGYPYTGILFFGGISIDGFPWNIEYNARHGDPEAQVVVTAVKNYAELVQACLTKSLGSASIEQDNLARVCVVGALKGYPMKQGSVKPIQIHGLEDAMQTARVFGAGVSVHDNKFYAESYGRLFSIVGEGRDVLEAREKAYNAMSRVSIIDSQGNNMFHYRKDIAHRDAARLN